MKINKKIQELLFSVAVEIQEFAKKEAPERTGTLKKSIEIDDRDLKNGIVKVGHFSTPEITVDTTEGKGIYPLFVHLGTGLFGPRKRKITPKRAKVLRFRVGDKTVFAKSVRGQEPNPYLERGLNKAIQSGAIERVIDKKGDEIVDEAEKDIVEEFKGKLEIKIEF